MERGWRLNHDGCIKLSTSSRDHNWCISFISITLVSPPNLWPSPLLVLTFFTNSFLTQVPTTPIQNVGNYAYLQTEESDIIPHGSTWHIIILLLIFHQPHWLLRRKGFQLIICPTSHDHAWIQNRSCDILTVWTCDLKPILNIGLQIIESIIPNNI